MPIFTSRELVLLANLKRDWGRLYRRELARLLLDEDDVSESHQARRKTLEDFLCLDFQS
jgi:hypothetical protein